MDNIKVATPALEALGKFGADKLPVKNLSMYQAKARMIFDRVGFK